MPDDAQPGFTKEDTMIFHPLFWHWLIFGMALIMLELLIPSFTIFWFGLSAIMVGAMLWIMPQMILSWQLLIWALGSCLFTFLWFKLFKPLMTDKTMAGISREAALGQTGMVIAAPDQRGRGALRFTTPVLGADEWPFISEQPVAVGDRVVVKDISGNTMIVAPHHSAAQAAG